MEFYRFEILSVHASRVHLNVKNRDRFLDYAITH